MANDFEKMILDEYPLDDYEAERAEYGYMSLVKETERRTLYPGVEFCERLYTRGDGVEVWVYLTTVAPDAKAQLAVSASPIRTVKFVKQHAAEFEAAFDKKVLYAMNASFFHYFNDGDLTPYGIQIMNGVEMSLPVSGENKKKPWYSHNFLAVDKEGKAFVCSSDEFYEKWRGKLAFAVGGGLRLIRDGKICLHHDPEYGPRTTVGFADDGTIILMCVDGRSERSGGISYADTIDIYTHLGYEIRELLNLDGGGSTTVVLREEDGTFGVRNVPSGPPLPISYSKYGITRGEPRGEEQARAVADTVLIIEK